MHVCAYLVQDVTFIKFHNPLKNRPLHWPISPMDQKSIPKRELMLTVMNFMLKKIIWNKFYKKFIIKCNLIEKIHYLDATCALKFILIIDYHWTQLLVIVCEANLDFLLAELHVVANMHLIKMNHFYLHS